MNLPVLQSRWFCLEKMVVSVAVHGVAQRSCRPGLNWWSCDLAPMPLCASCHHWYDGQRCPICPECHRLHHQRTHRWAGNTASPPPTSLTDTNTHTEFPRKYLIIKYKWRIITFLNLKRSSQNRRAAGCACDYLQHHAGFSLRIHNDSLALQRSDPQADFQLRLQPVRQSILDVAVTWETQRQVAWNPHMHTLQYVVRVRG